MNDAIVERARKLTRQLETHNPFRIAGYLGIDVEYEDLGGLKGMYLCIKRNRYIVINNQLDDRLQEIVCAHELGHDQFHREMAQDRWLHEFSINNMRQRPEREANLFASEMLLQDCEVMTLAMGGYTIEQIAGELNTDVNLVALKLDTIRRDGYEFRQFESRDDFLRW